MKHKKKGLQYFVTFVSFITHCLWVWSRFQLFLAQFSAIWLNNKAIVLVEERQGPRWAVCGIMAALLRKEQKFYLTSPFLGVSNSTKSGNLVLTRRVQKCLEMLRKPTNGFKFCNVLERKRAAFFDFFLYCKGQARTKQGLLKSGLKAKLTWTSQDWLKNGVEKFKFFFLFSVKERWKPFQVQAFNTQDAASDSEWLWWSKWEKVRYHRHCNSVEKKIHCGSSEQQEQVLHRPDFCWIRFSIVDSRYALHSWENKPEPQMVCARQKKSYMKPWTMNIAWPKILLQIHACQLPCLLSRKDWSVHQHFRIIYFGVHGQNTSSRFRGSVRFFCPFCCGRKPNNLDVFWP